MKLTPLTVKLTPLTACSSTNGWGSTSGSAGGGAGSNFAPYAGRLSDRPDVNSPMTEYNNDGSVALRAQRVQRGGIGDILGKIWALPNTVVGIILGYAGVLAGGDLPTLGNNAIQFTNNPLLGSRPGITFENAINYNTDQLDDINPSYTANVALGAHERGHTNQYQFLGPLFLPVYLAVEPFPGNNPFEVGADNYALKNPPNG